MAVLLLAVAASGQQEEGTASGASAPSRWRASARLDGVLGVPLIPPEVARGSTLRSADEEAADEPFLPAWLTIGGQIRVRGEYLDQQFRAANDGHNHVLALRTLVAATARWGASEATLEVIDSRQYGAPDDQPVGTDQVDPLDILQLYYAHAWEGVFADGDEVRMQLGRYTMDVGSRRFVARNAFRNTINAFTGANVTWTGEDDAGVRAFFVWPVQRLPTDMEELQHNHLDADEERTQVRFWGVHGQREVSEGLLGELYAFRLDEGDAHDLNTGNRDLLTVGARLREAPAVGAYHFELESAIQSGESRASTSNTDTNDLDHEAYFYHAAGGYTFDSPGKPRVEALLDYASGDESPNDDENNRFDALFGARAFDFGPTGIYGALARSNIFSPALRVNFKPCDRGTVQVTHRLAYLASDNDAWTTSGLRDATGDSGDEIGQQLDVQVRYDIVPKEVQLEVGAAHLFAGDFVDDAPNNTGQGDTTYGYVQTTFRF